MSLRDDTLAYTMNQKRRKEILREILQVEEDELGVSRVPSRAEESTRAAHQQRYAGRISQPLRPPSATHTDFLRCPRTLRGKGSRSLDTLFTANRDGSFWFYGSQKVSQATLGPLSGRSAPPTTEEVKKSPIGAAIRRQLESILSHALSKERFGIIFDLVSTSKIIASGAPHEVGAYIYHYLEEAHYDKTNLKFVFVGITDNVNCCAARDVFCRDDVVAGHYVGDTKRPFEALDNVHMYTVFPGHRLHPFRSTTPPPPPLALGVSSSSTAASPLLRGRSSAAESPTFPNESPGRSPIRGHSRLSAGGARSAVKPPARPGSHIQQRQALTSASPLPELRPGSVAALDAPSTFVTQSQSLR
jgi:hypothetical protein